MALGRKYEGEERKKFREIISEFIELMGGFRVGDYIPWLAWVSRVNGVDAKIEKVAKAFDDFMEGAVEEHKKRADDDDGDGDNEGIRHENGKDFVDFLLGIKSEN